MPKFVSPGKSKSATRSGSGGGTRNLSNGSATRKGGGGHTNTTGMPLTSDPRPGRNAERKVPGKPAEY